MPELRRGEARATVSVHGAWVEELNVRNEPVLHAKTMLRSDSGEEKARGGMHVCLPNFGPGGDSGLPQHGFGRSSDWTLTNTTKDSVALALEGGTTHYARLASSLVYALGDSSFEAVLTLANNGARTLRAAPAFHPYFALDESETAVKVNGVTYELSELAGTEFITAETVELVTAHQTLRLSQTGLATWAIWTDRLGPYVCVEPTFGGYRFLEPEQSDEQLAPGDSREYTFRIEW